MSVSGKYLDPLGENIDFRFNYTPKCMVSSMNNIFKKFSGEGLTEPPPQTPSPGRSISGFALDSRALCVLGSGCALNSPLQHVYKVYNPSPNREVLDQTLFSPNPNFLATPYWTQYIVPRLRSWINWNIPVIISLTAGWEDFLKIQRDERLIYTVLGIIAPETSILVQNAPKSLAAGAPPQTPLGELTALPARPPSCYGLGWRFGNNFFGV